MVELIIAAIKDWTDDDYTAGLCRELVLKKFQDHVLGPESEREVEPTPGAMSDDEKRMFACTNMPAGKFEGCSVGNVPLLYLLHWDTNQFNADLRRYLKHPDVQREQGEPE